MKKQEKKYMVVGLMLGLLVSVLIIMWSASRTINEGFRKGKKAEARRALKKSNQGAAKPSPSPAGYAQAPTAQVARQYIGTPKQSPPARYAQAPK